MNRTIFYSLLLLALLWSGAAKSQELINVAWEDTYRGSLQLCRHPQSGLFGIKRKDGTLLLPPEYREIRYVQHPCDAVGYFIFAQNDPKRKPNGGAMPPMPFRAYFSQGQPARGSIFLWSDFYNYGFLRDDAESQPTACAYKDIRFICDAPESPIIWLLNNNQRTQIAHLDARREKIVFDKAQWDLAQNLAQGLWALHKKNKIQLATLDYQQKWKPLLSGEYREALATEDGKYILLQSYQNKKWGCYAHQEGFLIPVLDFEYDSLQYLGEIPAPQMLAKQRKGWGLIQLETKPRTLVPLQYRYIERLGDYVFASQKDSTDIWQGDKLIKSLPFQALGTSPAIGLRLISYRKKWGLLNTQRLHIVCPIEYDSISIALPAKLLYLYQGGVQGIYSINQENALLPPQYDSIKHMGGANWAIYVANRVGCFQSELGKQVVPPIFDQIRPIQSEISDFRPYLVVQNGLYGIYESGQVLACAYNAPKAAGSYLFLERENGAAVLFNKRISLISPILMPAQPLDSLLVLRWKVQLPQSLNTSTILAQQKQVFLPNGADILRYSSAGDSLPSLRLSTKGLVLDSVAWVAPSSQNNIYFVAEKKACFYAWDAKKNKVLWKCETPTRIEFEPIYKDINKDKQLDICDRLGAWAINGKNGQLLAVSAVEKTLLAAEKPTEFQLGGLDFVEPTGPAFRLRGDVAVFGLGGYLWIGEAGQIKAFYSLASRLRGDVVRRDIDGDGELEFLWVGEDGYMYCYGLR